MHPIRMTSVVICVLGLRSISAETFLYIALVDLLADLRRRAGAAVALQRFVALTAGIVTISGVVSR